MSNPIRSLIAAAAIAIVPLGALTQAYAADPATTPGVDKRQANQDQRIDKGTESGALTNKETNRLERQQARIETAEDKAKADGVATKRERARLHHRQNKASRDIYRQKHDRQAG